MSRGTILVVEDEHDIQELLRFHLEREHFKVDAVDSGEDALTYLRRSRPCLVLLDRMLPGIDGDKVCAFIKESPETRHIPVIMLTAKDSENDIVAGFSGRADDYITKPFSPRVVLARVKAMLNRPPPGMAAATDAVINRGALSIDPAHFRVTTRGKEVPLSCTEFRMLYLLASHPGQAFTRQQIMTHIRGEAAPVTERIVDVQLVSIRKKLGPYGRWIQTVRNVGYRFREA